MMRILIIAAHPDDEVLGMGATIKKLAKNNQICLCVITEGASAQYDDVKMIEIRKNACIKSGKYLGISKFIFLNFKDMSLENIPQLQLNKDIEKIIKIFKPETVYVTSNNDLNTDHQKTFESTVIATRPFSSTVKNLICYEVVGYKEKPFQPNLFVNITKEYKYKVKAFQMYKSEINKFPHPRSVKSLENLAVYRGIESNLDKAEAFRIIRNTWD